MRRNPLPVERGRLLGRVRAEQDAGLVGALLGAFALAVAWVAEHPMHMAPCALCLLERWPYRVLLLAGLAATVSPAWARRSLLLLCALSLLGSIGLSLTHLGVEQHWWPDPLPQCMAPHFHGGTMSERLASMPRLPAKPCDAPNRLLPFLPLSMASLDLIYSVLASALIGATARGWRVR